MTEKKGTPSSELGLGYWETQEEEFKKRQEKSDAANEAANKQKAAEELGADFDAGRTANKSAPPKTHTIKAKIPYPVFVALSKYEKDATISVDKLVTTLLTEFLEAF